MVIKFEDKAVKDKGLTMNQFLILLNLSQKFNPTSEDFDILRKKNLILLDNALGERISNRGIEALKEIAIMSELDKNTKRNVDDLVVKMQSFFPEGKKAGTTQYWRSNVPDVTKKLRAFFRDYGNHDDEVIIDATRRYVESFAETHNTYMQLLKYFISKENKVSGEKVSELMAYIENAGSDKVSTNKDWTSNLV